MKKVNEQLLKRRSKFTDYKSVFTLNPSLDDFLNGKSQKTIELFDAFISAWAIVGKVTLHPTKSMIGITRKKKIAHITRLGKNFVDIVFPFEQAYPDNLCFHKIAQVPGTSQFNHHLRIFSEDDLNNEVLDFMKLSYSNDAE